MHFFIKDFVGSIFCCVYYACCGPKWKDGTWKLI